MTRDDWLTCSDPERMLKFLRDSASDRKLRLFACAWGHDVWRGLSDDRSRDAVRIGERFADGDATFAELLAVHRDAADAVQELSSALGTVPSKSSKAQNGVRRSAVLAEVARRAADPEWDARIAARAVAWLKGATRYTLSNHLRDIFNPYHVAAFDPAWLTSTVLAMARYAYDSADFSAMPILADALQDAGCEDDEVLTHCRDGSEHVRGCWVLDAILSKE